MNTTDKNIFNRLFSYGMGFSSRILNIYKEALSKVKPLPPGVHTLATTFQDGNPIRFHLRLEKDGKGLLIINAHTILHLNQSAAEFVYHIIQQDSPEFTADEIVSRYKISKEQAIADFQYINEQIETLVQSPDLAPDTFLDMERVEPFSKKPTAPYRLDCALTYQVSGGTTSSIAPIHRVNRELVTEEWKKIIQKAWNAGIPHVVFTGGEPTMRPDLVDLISYTQTLGVVCGLLTDGKKLANSKYLHQVLDAGLDHIMLVLNIADKEAWEGLKYTLNEDIFVTVHLTIDEDTDVKYIFQEFVKLGVKNISLSTAHQDKKDALLLAHRYAAESGMTLKWDLPVPFSNLHPVALERDPNSENISGAGSAWLYVEPDGDVVACQGSEKILGNFLTDDWVSIWKAPR